ncbi:MAG: hypothetical protein ABSG86_24435 [Thermoguttaceae bacterium]
MSMASERKTYRSPLSKLVRCFERSRDGWKRKCQEAKRVAKRFFNHIAKLKASRNRWKALARQYRHEVEQLREELAGIKTSPL